MFVDGRSGVFACVPGDDEGGTYAGLSPPCTDPTWGLNAGRRGRNQVVDVRVNVQSQIVIFPSPSVHQHYSITKVQKPIVCHSHIHLNTQTNTVLLIISHSHYHNCSITLVFSLTYIHYRSQNVVFEEVYFLNRQLALLFFLQILSL